MVILDNDLILKLTKFPKKNYAGKLSKTTADKRPAEESDKKCTHLYLNERKISDIADISLFSGVSSLYLHNNHLSSLNNIASLVNLTHLYLQRNRIRTISGIEKLTKLQKLYLGYNELSVIEGLENQCMLQLLHIEWQSLEPGGALYFDPRTLSTLQTCLEDLDVSHNRMGSILDLQHLRSLKQVNLSGNELTNLEELCNTVRVWTDVAHIQLSDNPVCKDKGYPNQVIIASSYSLKSLDGKQVSPISKVFLQKFEQEKLKRRKSAPGVSDVFSSEVKHLVKHLPEGLCRVVSGQILEDTLSGGPHAITYPLINFVDPPPKTELKFGLRGGKPRSKINKMKKSTTEDGSIPLDLPKPVEEAD